MKRMIEFTPETESNNSLLFLNIMSSHTNHDLDLSSYRKSTKKNDLIKFYSHQKNKVILGIIVSFYLRSLEF